MRTPEQEDSAELHIAKDAFNQKHGAFVNHMLEAFVNADRENFELLRPVMRKLFEKYEMRCNCGQGVTLTVPPKDAPVALAHYIQTFTAANEGAACSREQAVGWLSSQGWKESQIDSIIASAFGQGLLYESKPGFYRVVGENLDEAKKELQ